MSDAAATSDYALHRIIDFNFYPIAEMDDSWWQSDYLAKPLFVKLRNIKAARRKLSDFILESYQLKDEIYFDFASHEKQVALLSSDDLKSLLYSMGLILEADTIAHTIEREAQQAIKKAIGETNYLYALKNRISIQHPRTNGNIATTYEKVCDFADFKNHLYRSGLRCLLSLLNDMPQGFIQRILFKLPKAWSAVSPSHDKDDYREIKTCLPRLFKELKTS
ncbi:MAG: hypothetical protein F4Y58_04650 [Gammaproteobacteria bacterium]|nr:hypothetical protein [Gammaproteobacteria bacterium]